MGFLQQLGPLAIASRLKNLTDLLMRDMVHIYSGLKVGFEPRWFTFVYLIDRKGPMTITEIARELGQTHPAANQVANALELKGYCRSLRDRKDSRKRIMELTEQGRALIQELQPVWDAVEQAVTEMLDAAAPGFLDQITAIEEKLMDASMEERILGKLKNPGIEKVEILDYRDEYAPDFRTLNEAWLREFFTVEPEDERLLNNPGREIIGAGGTILLARKNGKIIGTGALIHADKSTCELTKMAVHKDHQGQQTGRMILRHLIRVAKNKNYYRIILLTSEKLHKAVALYESEGFKRIPPGATWGHNYQRCSIGMELTISST